MCNINLFNDDYLEMFCDDEQKKLNELAEKSYLSDEEFNNYKDILKLACDYKETKIRNYMFKSFCKQGKYNKNNVLKIVCLTRYGWNDLEGEKWKSKNEKVEDVIKKAVPDFSNINIGEIMVSNYGRVGIIKKNKKDKTKKYIYVLPQYEGEKRTYDGEEYYAEGYLCVDIPPKEKNLKTLKTFNVYKLVAEYWLEKHKENCEYHIHHINNNGYENTPANLIYLTKEQHSKIHKD